MYPWKTNQTKEFKLRILYCRIRLIVYRFVKEVKSYFNLVEIYTPALSLSGAWIQQKIKKT